MREHRLIERAIRQIDAGIARIEKNKRFNPVAVDTIVDLMQTYADRTHHGKEEEILFRDLEKKDLSEEHARVTRELIEEHRQARAMIHTIVEAKEKYLNGDKAALSIILANFQKLSEFYPKHIEKEDRHFFFPIMEYFSAAEKKGMLAEFEEFDRKMIHEKYTKIVDALEQADKGTRTFEMKNPAKQQEVRGHAYVCKVCGYVYDPAKGDPKRNIPPGIPFEQLSDDWTCPVCNAPKSRFSMK
jgi:hemerythrin-like domain-containing protein/rubredoxin